MGMIGTIQNAATTEVLLLFSRVGGGRWGWMRCEGEAEADEKSHMTVGSRSRLIHSDLILVEGKMRKVFFFCSQGPHAPG